MRNSYETIAREKESKKVAEEILKFCARINDHSLRKIEKKPTGYREISSASLQKFQFTSWPSLIVFNIRLLFKYLFSNFKLNFDLR